MRWSLWQIIFLCVRPAHGSTGLGSVPRMIPMFDNFRDPQPLRKRTIYRSEAASSTCQTCDAGEESTTCARPGKITDSMRPIDTTTPLHWSHADQAHWDEFKRFGYYGAEVMNECFHKTNTDGTFPGESPINFEAPELTPTGDASITVSGFDAERSGLTFANNGHSVTLFVCGTNSFDCSATVNFGSWPKKLRGIAGAAEEEYFLFQLHFHWGSDSTKGSEHQVCGKPRSAEMHMVLINKRPTAVDRNDPDSGLRLAVLGTMIEVGGEDNPAFENIFNAVGSQGVEYPMLLQPGNVPGPVNLQDLLPEDYDSKFYTYAGSLTTPPCTQVVSWFVFENFQRVSEAQMKKLRKARMQAVGPQIRHTAHHALLFPFVAILLGTAIYWLLSRYAPEFPYTVAVLFMGMVFAFFLDLATGDAEFSGRNHLRRSTNQWASIDGHLLLYGFLPALLFGDSMNINPHVLKTTFLQCLLLACPGVLLQTFLISLSAHSILPFGWNLDLCTVVGAVLAATDPVAVVALLQSVGASPFLTMQITGESLMNDGTAIVLFNIFWAKYQGIHTYRYEDFGAMVQYFLRMSVAGPLLGIAIGFVALRLLKMADRRYSKQDSTMQTSITVCTAYLSFFLGESESNVSGVLCCCSAAVVLAIYAKPIINNHEALEEVWHAIEYFGNTVLFFIAGVVIQRAIFGYDPFIKIGTTVPELFTARDYGLLLAFYLVVMLIRLLMMVVFYPILKRIGSDIRPQDALFMVWAGLRGAVGLSLALLVFQSGGDQRAGKQVLFVVSGLAFLTLVVNGVLSKRVLQKLGMLETSLAKHEILQKVHDRVEERTQKEYRNKCLEGDTNCENAVQYLSSLRTFQSPVTVTGDNDEVGPRQILYVEDDDLSGTESPRKCKKEFSTLETRLRALRDQGIEPDVIKVKMLRETFYSILRAEYWELIEHGHLPRDSPATLLLLYSIDMALDSESAMEESKGDWDCIIENLEGPMSTRFSSFIDTALEKIDDMIPCCVFHSELHYLINIKRMETQFHLCAAYATAHELTQIKLARFFGDDSTANTAEECVLIIESGKKVATARSYLQDINPELKKMVQTKVVADNLLHIEYSYVDRLVKQGVLSAKEAELLYKHIEIDQKLVQRAGNASAMGLAKRQVAYDLLRNYNKEGLLTENDSSPSQTIDEYSNQEVELTHVSIPKRRAAFGDMTAGSGGFSRSRNDSRSSADAGIPGMLKTGMKKSRSLLDVHRLSIESHRNSKESVPNATSNMSISKSDPSLNMTNSKSDPNFMRPGTFSMLKFILQSEHEQKAAEECSSFSEAPDDGFHDIGLNTDQAPDDGFHDIGLTIDDLANRQRGDSIDSEPPASALSDVDQITGDKPMVTMG